MKLLHALTAGLAGAITLTVAHQILQKLSDDAPRMDLLGEEALLKIADKTATEIPEKHLYKITMAADVASNTLFYSLAAPGKRQHATVRGGLLGFTAGVGGVCLPKYLGLNNAHSNRTTKTKLLTMAIYTLGGWVSGKVAAKLGKR